MKILVIGDEKRYLKNADIYKVPDGAILSFHPLEATDDELLKNDSDAEIVLLDAIVKISAYLIDNMPNLKMLHSEGVGFDGIDLEAATKRGIYVCNNKGCNAKAVAEQAVLLMLALLRNTVVGDAKVRAGLQIQAKHAAMVNGITELSACKVGLLGFGDIGRATAKLLRAFGCTVYYYKPNRCEKSVEEELGVTYLELNELAAQSDIVSIHTAVTYETTGMVGKEFLGLMKEGAYLINTARGEIVDNEALREALIEGKIAGAGLDTIYPEPTTADNPVVDLPEGIREKVIYSPHFGGITIQGMRRAQKHMWENVAKIAAGERPDCIVNNVQNRG
ncbi:MAG: 2-hydroxyacid dehydrogenase [Lachnospiraceae bacterium]|jgi:phosphoglycerate dehydrogenase-like enzyme|nr:2-hydroxyacid dehydrogenase [Lachnospiraceae bacterium]